MWGKRTAEEAIEHQSAVVRWLRRGILAAILLPAIGFFIAAWYSYHDTVSHARLRIDRAVRIGQEHASRVIETNEVITRQVLSLLGDAEDAEIMLRERALHEQFKRISQGIQQIQSIWVWDANGRPLASDRFYPVSHQLDVSDREYFRYHRDNRGGFFVSERLVSRSTGEPFFDITHRREREDGSFAGTISVALHPSYFMDFYRRLAQAEPGLVVTLFRADGSILARWPQANGIDHYPPSSAMLQRVASGATEGMLKLKSAIDGRTRLVAFNKLDRYPLYVAAGIETQIILSAWLANVAMLAAFAFPTSIALAYVCLVALRRARREIVAVQRLRDETAQRSRAEEALRQAQKLEAMGRLTGGVAHDFNNLLMVINNNVHLLRRIKPDMAESTQLAAIGRAVSSGEKLTRQLLAFSRRHALRPEVIRLQDALPSLLSLIAPAVGKGIRLVSDIAADTLPVEVDPAELELAIINLTMNAKDAMPEGGALTVRARNAKPGEIEGVKGEVVAIDVVDTGQGIAPELMEKVFEPFFTTKPPGKGTGLGLSQVYALCAQAGGAAQVESRVGQGTTVHLYLPATRKSVARVVPGAVEPATQLDCNVLLVEDNKDVADATRQLLAALGCKVRHAASADEARQIIDSRAERIDVVLSDIVMPGAIDGLALAKELRTTHRDLPVILMTGYTAELQNAAQLSLEVLPKPCSPETLSTALAHALKRRQAVLAD